MSISKAIVRILYWQLEFPFLAKPLGSIGIVLSYFPLKKASFYLIDAKVSQVVAMAGAFFS
ncbi:hypothetical protein [Algoriphagus aquimarinus]|uniref:Uncharacterized protein n=1 Tax=Algoriphagus aquimarinus TaxID=237018 RepID=A0A1I1C5K3_9BACT|nr:hypothetical protein [Algoriphagus aquimarinus]SFB57266.1 hypothetical protein SAMN04489723_12217 [Algoriphagus aquimarinus]